jgi:hypothetical protein
MAWRCSNCTLSNNKNATECLACGMLLADNIDHNPSSDSNPDPSSESLTRAESLKKMLGVKPSEEEEGKERGGVGGGGEGRGEGVEEEEEYDLFAKGVGDLDSEEEEGNPWRESKTGEEDNEGAGR